MENLFKLTFEECEERIKEVKQHIRMLKKLLSVTSLIEAYDSSNYVLNEFVLSSLKQELALRETQLKLFELEKKVSL